MAETLRQARHGTRSTSSVSFAILAAPRLSRCASLTALHQARSSRWASRPESSIQSHCTCTRPIYDLSPPFICATCRAAILTTRCLDPRAVIAHRSVSGQLLPKRDLRAASAQRREDTSSRPAPALGAQFCLRQFSNILPGCTRWRSLTPNPKGQGRLTRADEIEVGGGAVAWLAAGKTAEPSAAWLRPKLLPTASLGDLRHLPDSAQMQSLRHTR